MASVLLTDSKIRGLKPKDTAYYTWQASATRGTGRLGVKTYPSGRKVFVYRYFREGKGKFITLGDYPALTLAEATEKSREAAENSAAPERVTIEYATVKNLFDDYITDCSGQLKLATVLEFSQYNRSDSLGVRPPLY